MSNEAFEALERHYRSMQDAHAPDRLVLLLRAERERRLSNRAFVAAAVLVFAVSSLVLAVAAASAPEAAPGSSLPYFHRNLSQLDEQVGREGA